MLTEKGYCLLPSTPTDAEFLFRVYAGTRESEMTLTGWDSDQAEDFLRFQFSLQQSQYHHNFPGASFDIIYLDDRQAGCLYINRTPEEIRIINIALLPHFRRLGYGTRILRDIINEACTAGLPLRLAVARDNPALSLYIRLGFTCTSDTDFYYFLERSPPVPVSGGQKK
jgi:ribosomal protein S18 acetylase RimI-like enzyme